LDGSYLEYRNRVPFRLLLIGLVVWALAPLFSQPSGGDARRRKPVSFAILEDYDKNSDLAEVEADIALFDELEMTTWRGSFGWDDYEPERGRFDFNWLDSFVGLMEREGITLRPYLGYTPDWAARHGEGDADIWNNPPARIQDWERFAGAIARRLRAHRNVASIEIYNEENVRQWWDGTAQEYGETLRSGGRAIKAGAALPVIFGGLVFPDRDWLEAVCEVAGVNRAFDIIPFHAYPETWTPADVTVENYLGGLDAFVEAADARCGRKPVWINETGFATVEGKSEREQAHWWVRAVATFLASPRVEHIGVYEIRDLAADRPAIGDTPNYHLGLVRVDRTRKLAFHTVDLLTDLLDVGTLSVDTADARVSVVDREAGELHYELFGRPDGDRVLFVWDRTASPVVRVDVGGRYSSLEFDVDGRPLAWDAEGVALSRIPLARGVPRIFKLMRDPACGRSC
jgi:polysaccharide biosynthesis protein PslG